MTAPSVTGVDHRRVVPRTGRETWSLLADFGGLARWAPGIDHSCLTTVRQEGVGTVRRVQVGATVLLEEVTRWEPGRALAYAITGLPPLVGAVTTEWQLQPTGPAETEVEVTTTVAGGRRPPQRLAAKLVAVRLGRAAHAMLGGLAAATPASEGRTSP